VSPVVVVLAKAVATGLVAGVLAAGFVVSQRVVPAEAPRWAAEAQRAHDGDRATAFR